MVDHPNITLGKATVVEVAKTPAKLPLRASLEANGEIVLALKSAVSPMIRVGDWVWQDNTFQPLGLPAALEEVLRAPVRVPQARRCRCSSANSGPRLQAAGTVEANFKLEDFVLEPQVATFSAGTEGRPGATQRVAAMRLRRPHHDAGGDLRRRSRLAARSRCADPLFHARHRPPSAPRWRGCSGSGFTGPDAQGKLQLLGQNAVLNFFAREYPKLEREWQVTLEERLERSTQQNLERIEPQFQITSSGVQWFDLGVVFARPAARPFPPAEIQRLLLSGQSHTRLKNGKMAVIDTGAVEELQEVLRDCAPQQHGRATGSTTPRPGFLEATLRQHAKWQVQAPAAWRERAARQSGEAKLECPPLGELEPVLRPYQKARRGLAAVSARKRFRRHPGRRNGAGQNPAGAGVSARSVRRAAARPPRPMLVVCPTSLVFNWVAEAAKFTPALKVLALHGPDRHASFDAIPRARLGGHQLRA